MAEKTTNAKETLESSVTRVEDSVHIDPTKVSCSIYVTGFQATTKPDDLIIHFQRKRNGGGDIDSITVNKRGAAVITFDDPEVVKSVLQKKQEIEGVVLTVKPYKQTVRKEDHNYEVFELVSAELGLETVEVLTREQTRILLKEIAGKTGINWIEVSENFVMSGAFKQVEMSRIYLQQAINQSGGISVFTARLEGKQLDPQKREETQSHFGGEEDGEDLKQTSYRMNAPRDEEDGPQEEPNETQSNHFASVNPPEMQYFEVEPKFIKVFAKAHKSEIDEIEAKYLVKIPTETKSGKISLKPNDGCSTEEYNEACDLFIGLYQQMTLVMKMERFSLKCEKNVIPARKKIHEMSKRIPVLVELEKDQKHWCLYGEEQHLNDALKFLEKEKVEIKRELKHGNRTEGFPGPRDHEEVMDVDPPDSSKGGRSNDLLETYIEKVKVSVYQGDLTRERVDVVVNAANNRLRHDGGVAKAILDRGGKSIEKESDKIIRDGRPLKDGQVAITSAGKLPCKKIVHAVGPDCRNLGLFHSKKVLRQACINSFKISEEWKMTSIALPAIGSGTNGMPKDECAKVMFDAVEEFVRQGKPKKKTITDIRFVNVDDPSVQAFRKEFISRYGDIQGSEMMGSGKDVKRPPAGAEGANSSVTSSSRPDRGKNKSNKSPFDNDRTTANPSSHHCNASFGMDHPLSTSNHPFSQNVSYSGAVKNNQGGTITRSPTGQEPRGAGKTGFSLPSGTTSHRKDEDSGSGGAGSKAECPICLDTISNARALKCKHVFCSDCVETALKHDNRCPVCKEVQGVMQGNQPKGTMQVHKSYHQRLPGYHDCGTITIDYSFPSGIQGQEHPNPGQRYYGTHRTAYLPDNREGNEVLQLLRRAFDARLIFTVGTSVTTGMQNQVTWNDIHHKTNMYGGPHGFGYPDLDYLKRVKEDLAAKGIR